MRTFSLSITEALSINVVIYFSLFFLSVVPIAYSNDVRTPLDCIRIFFI